jgi:hypothetical protein
LEGSDHGQGKQQNEEGSQEKEEGKKVTNIGGMPDTHASDVIALARQYSGRSHSQYILNAMPRILVP